MELLVATGNAHKVGEIREILAGIPVTWRTTDEWPLATEVEEGGDTYEQNAEIKARVWSDRTGLWTLSDDSGIEVEALGGRPGVRSARYARPGESAIQKMLKELSSVPDGKRRARFVCAVCLASPEGRTKMAHGYLYGHIAFEPRGDGGFGYDPIFVPEGFNGRHLAQLSVDEKNRISHRARALQAMRPEIEAAIQSNGQ